MQTAEQLQPLELVAITKKEQLQDDTAALIIEKFMPFQAQIDEWKAKAETLVVTDISQTEAMEEARKARLALRKVRTGADKVREDLKAESLRYGRAVQGIYNLIEAGIKPIEEHLEKQEKFKELFELKQRETLRVEREELSKDVREYMIANINLGEITQEDFDNLLAGATLQKQAAEDAKNRDEQIRIERERVNNLHEKRKQSVIHLYAYWTEFERTLNFGEQSESDFQNFVSRLNKAQQEEADKAEALRVENERLLQQQEEQERLMQYRKAMNDQRWQELAPYNNFGDPVNPMTLWELSDKDFDLMLAEKIHAYEMKKEQNIKEAAERKAVEEKAAMEAKERERLQKELDEEKERQAKIEADQLAKEEAELSKGDKDKFADMINDLDAIKTKYQFKSAKYKGIHAAVSELVNKTIVYAQSKTK